MVANKNINSVQDYDDVLAVVQGYVEGLRTGDVEQLKKTFHKDAVMYGHLPEGLYRLPLIDSSRWRMESYCKIIPPVQQIKSKFYKALLVMIHCQ
jgi:hypothetical protein